MKITAVEKKNTIVVIRFDEKPDYMYCDHRMFQHIENAEGNIIGRKVQVKYKDEKNKHYPRKIIFLDEAKA